MIAYVWESGAALCPYAYYIVYFDLGAKKHLAEQLAKESEYERVHHGAKQGRM
jgi:hypothetical protein